MAHLDATAEKKAELAENLPQFLGIKLLHIKNSVEEILKLFGRNDIFDEYTKHDISHINKMLKMLDWLIPEATQEEMTSADWLMLVLSIYFHDLGLIVTKEEYDNRQNDPYFEIYKNNILSGNLGTELKNKVLNLKEGMDKFLYQEYIRSVHPSRIKCWIQNESKQSESLTIVSEIEALLKYCPALFKRDLGILCESHHLDDLEDFEKYDPHKCYGDELGEVVNLHYIAIILRTADLLHITLDRTPSIQFRLINPADPISVLEWQKQSSVQAIQPKLRINNEGNVDKSLQSDTIEITAFFENSEQAEAYFGLTSYILYVAEQLQKSYKLVQDCIKSQGTNYSFPWEKIDDKKVTANGFIQKQFQFTLDQNSILQLLIGHTLYNDASVVIRELIQNSIDAIKLQNRIEVESTLPLTDGNIIVNWKSSERVLSVCDNGTGMTVDDIENYLLKVGTSKYRSDEFIKKYPNFSSISRFGIGILTCFMVADQVDIYTTSNDTSENYTNHIAIRNANGRYLLKQLNKNGVDKSIRNHGTIIKLNVRSDINMDALIKDAQKWIVLPQCKVEFLIDDNEPILVGHSSLKNVLVDYLSSSNLVVDNINMRIVEDTIDGLDIAYVQKYNKFLDEWKFFTIDQRFRKNEKKMLPLGTCVEGIRVEFTTPGYTRNNIFAIANVTGRSSAKTNVARSAIENNDDQNNLYSNIYKLYTLAVKNEIDRSLKQSKSLAKAASLAQFLVNELLPGNQRSDEGREPTNSNLLFQELDNLQCILVEENGIKKLVSPQDVINMHNIKIINSRVINEAEYLMREISSDKSLGDLLKFLGVELDKKEEKPVICNYNKFNILHFDALKGKQVESIIVDKINRRVDVSYVVGESNWIRYELSSLEAHIDLNQYVHIPKKEFIIENLNGHELGVEVSTGIYLASNNPISDYIMRVIPIFEANTKDEDAYLFTIFLSILLNKTTLRTIAHGEYRERMEENYLKFVWSRNFQNEEVDKIFKLINKDEFLSIIFENAYSFYNVYEWSRNPQPKNPYE